MQIKRLASGDRELARQLFALLATIFEEECQRLSDGYIDGLLSQPDFWAFAAFAGSDMVGGLTAYTLPMTRSECSEVFVYDIAVQQDHRRTGVGRALMEGLQSAAASAGIKEAFVAADDDDRHALDFYRALGGRSSPVTFFTFSSSDD